MYGVPRVWKPAISCQFCNYPNDEGSSFCQSCGNKLCCVEEQPREMFDYVSEKRLRYLDNLVEDTPYTRKISALEKEFTNFLSYYSKTLNTAEPDDVRKFLVFKDNMGKTQVHEQFCENLGKSGVHGCECPTRLASGTIQTTISKLKSIFKNVGRGDKWNDDLLFGNPACSSKVNKYLNAVKREQAISHRVVQQAKPLFLDKLYDIAAFIDTKLVACDDNVQKFILLRDQAFLKLQFFGGDRASDLSQCLSQEFKRLNDDSGFVVTHTVGKTLGDGKTNEFCIMRLDDHTICPVFGLEKYVTGAKDLGINLSLGYLFRILDNSRENILESPVSYSSMYSRLKFYLKSLGIDEGETLHSLRGGCAVTLAVLGCGSSEEIMSHVGWSSHRSLERYSRINKFVDNKVGKRLKEVSDLSKTKCVSDIYDKVGDAGKLPSAFS